MRLAASLCTLVLLASGCTPAQSQGGLTLEKKLPMAFGQLSNVVELGDGRVAFADTKAKLFLAADFNTGKVDTLGTRVDIFRVEGLSMSEGQKAINFAHEQIGKGYDFLSIARFLIRSQSRRKESGRWFCSELVFAALRKAGVDLLERIEPCDVSPGMLALSPRLILDEQIGGDAK